MRAFRDKITLYTETQDYGAGRGQTRSDEVTVRCRVEEVGTLVSQTAAAAGITLTHQVILWKAEYSGQNRAELDGTAYEVQNTGRTENSLQIKLLLRRG
ncbi:MAG: hypothetical protein IJY28_04055 [Clostridia bacterium]|nr:hypothetical protein [Clostridia bacterium]